LKKELNRVNDPLFSILFPFSISPIFKRAVPRTAGDPPFIHFPLTPFGGYMRILSALLVAVSIAALLPGCEKQPVPPTPVERGEYLVMIMGCDDCHSPKVMDPVRGPMIDSTRRLSGNREGLLYPTWTPEDLQNRNAMALTNTDLTAWAGPWGVSFPMNLTPDNETGIGEWTEESFMAALRTGKHQGQPDGRPILPPMPLTSFTKMPDNDMKAIWAYLRSIPPVKNMVPLPVPPAGMPQ
jgi:hypothetical protein